MSVFQRRDSHPALILGPGDGRAVSFEELRREVDARKGGSPELESLVAEPTLDFVAYAIARFEVARPFAIVNSKWSEKERAERAKLLESKPAPETALVLFTSGSSGAPKGVQLSKRAIDANTKAVIDSLDFAKVTHQILHLPLHYAYSLLGQLLPALQLGVTTRLLESFNDVLPLVRETKIDGMWSGVPSHYEVLLRILPPELNVDGVTHIVSAGAPFPVSLREKLHARFPKAMLYNNYGMTECGPRILSFSSRHPKFFTEAVGYPVGELKVRTDSEGQLEVSGPQVMEGYICDEKGTRERVEKGWLKTGDLAQIAPDGLVTVKGRKDDLVKVAGERIALSEIETALKALSGIEDAAVMVREHPIQGTQLVAFVVAKNSDKEKWIKDLGQLLAPAKIPRDYRELGALPRLDSGKIDRARLRAILADN